eukprot:Opistho-1_new@93241
MRARAVLLSALALRLFSRGASPFSRHTAHPSRGFAAMAAAVPKLEKSSAPLPNLTAVEGLLGAIGNTPLIRIASLSRETGCDIYAKAEHMNPAGSVKDRAARRMILNAEKEGRLVPGRGVVVEGTGGNTGVALAMVARQRGYKTVFTMPDTVSQEKIDLMTLFGAEVVLRPVLPFSDPLHYYHAADRIAKEREGGFFANQFENTSNFDAHFEETGPEIWRQTNGRVDGFVCSSGTGGTMAGVSTYLRQQNPSIAVHLIDPPGSGLLSYVERGVFEADGKTITEGIGIMRLTANFARAKVDSAFFGTDRETVEMGYYLLKHDGLFVGPSAALNCVGAVKLARKLGPGKSIVTVLCDGGDRYRSKMYNSAWIAEKGLAPEWTRTDLAFVL